MGGSSSKGQVLAPQAQMPPEPPYPGPVCQYASIMTEVTMQASMGFSFANNMMTTNIDCYYPILGQKYAEGFRLLTFHKIPGSARQKGLFSMSVAIPFQGIFCRYPTLPPPAPLQLRVVKSVMVAHRMGLGLLQLNPQIVGDTSHLIQAIVDNTKDGGRLICLEMTGQQQSQGFSAAMSGVSPIMGVDLFFEIPTTPTQERFIYQSVPVPVTLQTQMSFGGGVSCTADWNGVLGAYLMQGWKLVEIFFDMGQHRHGAFSTSATMTSVWFFEKPVSMIQDNRPIFQGTVITHYITITGGFTGASARVDWEPLVQQMGNQGWELACFVETPESRVSGFGKAEMKILLFFQRPIIN